MFGAGGGSTSGVQVRVAEADWLPYGSTERTANVCCACVRPAYDFGLVHAVNAPLSSAQTAPAASPDSVNSNAADVDATTPVGPLMISGTGAGVASTVQVRVAGRLSSPSASTATTANVCEPSPSGP